MRTFNGLQIFTQQLTNSGQLDLRYVRISGNNQPANLFFGNLSQDYSFYKNQNFNITNTFNVFICDDNNTYTGYLPNIQDKKIFILKNLSPVGQNALTVSGYAPSQGFDQSDELLTVPNLNGLSILGVVNNNYTGWVNFNYTQGII
jgi:hypothetical protein